MRPPRPPPRANPSAWALTTRRFRVTIVEPGELDTQWATGSMRFADPVPAYDELRTSIFGSASPPRQEHGTGGGTSPADAARAIVDHVDAPDDRLRLLVGDDSPGQVAAALALRLEDYRRDERFRRVE